MNLHTKVKCPMTVKQPSKGEAGPSLPCKHCRVVQQRTRELEQVDELVQDKLQCG